jgi:hypothetical protein
MSPQQLSAAIRLSIESALKSRETSVAEVVFLLEAHKMQLVRMATQGTPVEPTLQPGMQDGLWAAGPNGNAQ